MITQLVKKTLVSSLWCALGRRDLARLGRFLSNEARFDVANEMQRNGERLVQQIALEGLLTKPHNTVFDIGANVGLWSRSLLDYASGAVQLHVHAFEPCPETLASLRGNLVRWKYERSVLVNALALSSAAGEMKFYSHGPNIGQNSLHPAADAATQKVQMVALQTLDHYCAEKQIAQIGLVKIDTEGHDFKVIQGAADMLAKRRIDAIQFEYNWRWIDARHYLKDVFAYLLPLGYAIGKVTPCGIEFYGKWHFELETFREANFLIVRSPLVSMFPQVRWWND